MNVIDGCKKYHFVLFQSVVMIALSSLRRTGNEKS